MTYQPIDIAAFGGLDFTDEEDANGAIDMLNCYVERQGKLAVRPGYAATGAATSGVGASGSYAYNAFASYTNLVANPDFESGTTNWTGSGATLSQGGSAGSRYAKLLFGLAGTGTATTDYITSITGGAVYSAQLLVTETFYISSADVIVYWYTASSATPISSVTLTRPGGAPSSWLGLYSKALITAPATATRAKLQLTCVASSAASRISFDSALLTAGDYSGSFFTGTQTFSSSNVVAGYTDTVRLLTSTGASPATALTGVTGVASTDTFTKTAHGLTDGRTVRLSALDGGTGLFTSTTYYIINSAANTFKLSTSSGGSAVDFTTDVTSVTVTPDVWLTATTGNPWSFTALGGNAYGGNGKSALVQATTSAITQPSVYTRANPLAAWSETYPVAASKASPKPLYVTYQTPDNRLVAAGFTGTADGPDGATTTPATIFFSQGDSTWPSGYNALHWDKSDYVIVGDSQDPITGVANWGDTLVVMKQNDWFLFYGNSTDADGGTVFNYRRIEPGCEMVSWAVGVNGLYVTDTDSNIHRFTGGVPQIVFRGSSRYQALSGQGFNAHPFVGLPAQANGKQGYLIYDDRLGQVYFFAFDKTLTAGSNAGQSVYFPYTTGLAVFPSGTTDDATAITASYTSSYNAFGRAGVEKTIRQTEIHGSGTVELSWGRELQTHGSATTVLMTNGRGLGRLAARGESLSWKVSGSGWSINRLVHYLRELRPPGVKT